MSKTSLHTRRIVISALFLAIALVLRTFARVDIPIFGESGMRISFHGIFSIMPSILFGPVYGAMVSGLTDMMGHFISPTGAWLPQLTVVAAAGGFIRGWLWIGLKKRGTKTLRTVLVCVGVVSVLTGGYHLYALNRDGITRDFYENIEEKVCFAGLPEGASRPLPDGSFCWEVDTVRTEHTDANGNVFYRVYETIYVGRIVNEQWGLSGLRVIVERYNDEGRFTRSVDVNASHVSTAGLRWISRMAVTRSFGTVGQTGVLGEFITLTTWTMIGVGGFVLLLLLLDIAVRKALKKYEPLPHTLALVLAMMIPAILVSTHNTWVMRQTILTSWQVLPFVVVWLPRVVQSVATTTINVFFVTMLIGLCEKQPHIKNLLRK
ncbi:MAG: folate family ECF transporter S component [Defluviitaleaceae bacterium]|nr:folate family ECF transporter S component [Defluviitaleaceae bacterium]